MQQDITVYFKSQLENHIMCKPKRTMLCADLENNMPGTMLFTTP